MLTDLAKWTFVLLTSHHHLDLFPHGRKIIKHGVLPLPFPSDAYVSSVHSSVQLGRASGSDATNSSPLDADTGVCQVNNCPIVLETPIACYGLHYHFVCCVGVVTDRNVHPKGHGDKLVFRDQKNIFFRRVKL